MTEIEDYIPTDTKTSISRRILHSISFNIRLIFKNLSNRKRSTVIIILGLVFSLSMLYTASIWTNTSDKIIADDYIETLDYEMYVQSFENDYFRYAEVYDFVNQDSLTDQVDWIFPSIALFNFEDKGPLYRWYPENDQEDMSNPLSISSGFVISNRAMDRIKLNLEIEGNDTLQSGEIMISYTQARQLEAIYNETISPGYVIKVAITRRIPNTDEGEVLMQYYDIDDTTFENYTVAGIYNYVGYETIIDKLIGGGVVQSEGMVIDSVFFPIEDLTFTDLDLMTVNGILPKLLVKTDAQQLRADGILQMPDNLVALKERIEIRFYHAYCQIMSQEIQTMTDEYRRSFASTNLFIPAIASAVLLTILSTQITVRRRREEIAFLRSKGAASSQIIAMFFGEFLFVSVVSLILSIGFGILLSALIPSFGHGQFFNSSLFVRYLRELEVSLYDIEIFSVLVLGVYLALTLLNVIIFVRRDIHESMLVTRKGQQILNMGIKIAAFALTLAGFIFLIIDYNNILGAYYTFGFAVISASTKTLYAYIGVIFFVCFFISWGINYLLRASSKIFNYLSKNGGFLISKNIKRQRKNFTEITFFLVLIICLITSFITIGSTVTQNNMLEDQYRRGADIRIQSIVPVNISEYEQKISAIEGVELVTGFYTIRASIGLQTVEVFGVDPLKYLSIGNWIDTSFVDMTATEAMTALATNEAGVILSDYIALRLGFTVGRPMFITDVRGGPFYIHLNVSSISLSAPGLGVSHGHDPKMNRGANEWAMINRNLFQSLLNIENGTLFLASVKEGANIEQVAQEISELNHLFNINPEKINPDYIGYFITDYIPPVTLTLIIGAIVLNVIGVVFIVISTDFILEQRRRENAVLLALGGKQSTIRRLIVIEILVYLLTTILIGIPTGILIALFSLSFIKPLLIPQEIITMTLSVDFATIFIMTLSLCVAGLIGIIPILRKQMKYEIVQELRAIV
jgi:ABC-type lipoprotein release transport system permease subunit